MLHFTLPVVCAFVHPGVFVFYLLNFKLISLDAQSAEPTIFHSRDKRASDLLRSQLVLDNKEEMTHKVRCVTAKVWCEHKTLSLNTRSAEWNNIIIIIETLYERMCNGQQAHTCLVERGEETIPAHSHTHRYIHTGTHTHTHLDKVYRWCRSDASPEHN